MNTKLSVSTLASVACVAALTLGASGAAQAQDDIYWSIGMSSPGVQVGVSNAPTVYVQPPVYVQSAPVYVQPAPVYVQPRPYYVVPPRPVVYVPLQPVYYGRPGYGYGGHEGYRGYGYRNEHEHEHEHKHEHGGYRGDGDRGEERHEHRGDGRGEFRPQGYSVGQGNRIAEVRMAPGLTMGRRH